MSEEKEARPLDSTAQALSAWASASEGSPARARAKAIALATAENKLSGARRRLGKQEAMTEPPRALGHTQRWHNLAVRHLASVITDDPSAYFEMQFDDAVRVVSAAGYEVEPIAP